MSLTDKMNNEVSVTNNQSKGRYEINYAGESATAGYADYITRTTDGDNDERIFIHTVVGDEFEGRGLTSILIKEALKDTLPTGLTVVGACPFVKGFVEKNGYDGPYRNPTQEDFTWLEERVIEEKGRN